MPQSDSAAPLASTDPARLTLATYARGWLERTRKRVRQQSALRYEWVLERYVLPELGRYELTELRKVHVIDMVDAIRNRGLSPASARSAHATLSAVLTDAVDRDVLAINPALRLPRSQRRMLKGATREITIYTGEQLSLFLDTAERVAGELAGLYFAMGRAGLRVGEAIGLQHADVTLAGSRRQLTVRRTVRMGGRIGPPKDGSERVVDMTESLARILARTERHSSWMFPALRRGRRGPIGYSKVRALQRAIAAEAGLVDPGPHGLRKACATFLISQGISPDYVRQQLGHASVDLTCKTYAPHAAHQVPGLYASL